MRQRYTLLKIILKVKFDFLAAICVAETKTHILLKSVDSSVTLESKINRNVEL